MERRDFIKLSSMALAGLFTPRVWASAPRNNSVADNKYSIVILGDTHYDAADPEYYHAGYHDPNPKRAACLVDEDTRFIFQVGDLIQGDTALTTTSCMGVGPF